MIRKLPQRQARRCNYLFSVAAAGFDLQLAHRPTPPARAEFPPSHNLLDTSWRRYLAAMENVLAHQPFLVGERFTLADASAHGQLSMNLIDGKAAEILQQLAPLTFGWLCKIRDGDHVDSTGELYLSDQLLPLLEIIGETFMPLMRQNETAYASALGQGQTLFNEAAFVRAQLNKSDAANLKRNHPLLIPPRHPRIVQAGTSPHCPGGDIPALSRRGHPLCRTTCTVQAGTPG